MIGESGSDILCSIIAKRRAQCSESLSGQVPKPGMLKNVNDDDGNY